MTLLRFSGRSWLHATQFETCVRKQPVVIWSSASLWVSIYCLCIPWYSFAATLKFHYNEIVYKHTSLYWDSNYIVFYGKKTYTKLNTSLYQGFTISQYTLRNMAYMKICIWSTKFAQQSQRTHSADLIDRSLADNVYKETSTNMLLAGTILGSGCNHSSRTLK